jgi:malyl-CoA/(S)-citramalyl-CoA lyase
MPHSAGRARLDRPDRSPADVVPPPAARPCRPNRCPLFGPASRPALLAKMAASAADVLNLDREDSVAPSDKAEARALAAAATHDVDWGRKTLSVRINGLDAPGWYQDVVTLIEKGSERLDLIMIPKVGCAADLYAVDARVTAVEKAAGRTKRIGFEAIIESAAGIIHVAEIAAATPRLPSISRGRPTSPPRWGCRPPASAAPSPLATC